MVESNGSRPLYADRTPFLPKQMVLNWCADQLARRDGDPNIRLQDQDQRPFDLMRNFGKAILFEDNDLLIINKPPGVNCHCPESGDISVGVLEIARLLRDDNVHLSNRLDKATSGIVILTKTDAAFQNVFRQFLKKIDMEKHYVALVDGEWNEQEERVDLFIDQDSEFRQKMIAIQSEDISQHPNAQHTISFFDSIAVLRSGRSGRLRTLMDVEIVTGKKHQIRISALAKGHPVSGDTLYNPDKDTDIRRLMLHCRLMILNHPTTGERLVIEAPIPYRMHEAINNNMEWEY